MFWFTKQQTTDTRTHNKTNYYLALFFCLSKLAQLKGGKKTAKKKSITSLTQFNNIIISNFKINVLAKASVTSISSAPNTAKT